MPATSKNSSVSFITRSPLKLKTGNFYIIICSQRRKERREWPLGWPNSLGQFHQSLLTVESTQKGLGEAKKFLSSPIREVARRQQLTKLRALSLLEEQSRISASTTEAKTVLRKRVKRLLRLLSADEEFCWYTMIALTPIQKRSQWQSRLKIIKKKKAAAARVVFFQHSSCRFSGGLSICYSDNFILNQLIGLIRSLMGFIWPELRSHSLKCPWMCAFSTFIWERFIPLSRIDLVSSCISSCLSFSCFLKIGGMSTRRSISFQLSSGRTSAQKSQGCIKLYIYTSAGMQSGVSIPGLFPEKFMPVSLKNIYRFLRGALQGPTTRARLSPVKIGGQIVQQLKTESIELQTRRIGQATVIFMLTHLSTQTILAEAATSTVQFSQLRIWTDPTAASRQMQDQTQLTILMSCPLQSSFFTVMHQERFEM